MTVRSCWGAAMLVALLVVGVVPLAHARGQAHSGARSVTPSLLVPLPAPGHVTIETLTIRVTGKRLGRLPARLRLRAPTVRSLPRSVRILYARRTTRTKHTITYRLVLLAINVAARQGTRQARAAQDSSPPPDGHLLGRAPLGFNSGGAKLNVFAGRNSGRPDTAQDSTEWNEILDGARLRNQMAASSWRNADVGSAGRGHLIVEAVKPVLGGGTNPEPRLDTGHYDDGHAFGWRPEGEKQALHEITNANLDRLVADLERDMGADINGDGTIGSSQACTRASRSTTTDQLSSSALSGRDICTTVGPPVVTGGP
jgi:hypothetical protein